MKNTPAPKRNIHVPRPESHSVCVALEAVCTPTLTLHVQAFVMAV